MTKHEKAEIIFNKTLAKHSNLADYKKNATKESVVIYLKEIIDDYFSVLKLVGMEKNTQNNISLARLNLAELYFTMKEEQEGRKYLYRARDGFELLISKFPSFYKGYQNRISINIKVIKLYEKDNTHQLIPLRLSWIEKDYFSLLKLYINDINLWDELSSKMSEVANFFLLLGDYSTTLDFFKYSIDCNKRILALDSEDKISSLNSAITQSEMAKVYLILGQEKEAIEFFEKSINRLKSKNDVISFNSRAISYTEMANIYRLNMIRENSLELFEKAEKLYQKSNESYDKSVKLAPNDIETFINMAGNYSEWGMFYIYSKDNKKAIHLFNSSLDRLNQASDFDITFQIFKKIMENIDSVNLRLAEAYKREKEFDKALAILERTVVSENNNSNKSSIQMELGNLYLEKEIHNKAMNYFDKALSSFLSQLKINPNSLLLLGNLSTLLQQILKISQKSYYVDKAIWCNREILKIYSNNSIDIGFEEDLFSTTWQMTFYLNRLLNIYMKSNRDIDSNIVMVLESIKSKRLKQLLIANQFKDANSWLGESEIDEFHRLKRELDSVKKKIQMEELTFLNFEKKESLYRDFQKYSQQISKLLDMDEDDDWLIYDNLKEETIFVYPVQDENNISVITVQKIENNIKVSLSKSKMNSNVDFSVYFYFIKYIESLFESKDYLEKCYFEEIEDIPIDDEIKDEIFYIDRDKKSCYFEMEKEEFIRGYKYDIVQIALSHIKEVILSAIPKDIKKIVFSPLGNLNLLPLHAIEGNNAYLIENYEISYAPSLSIWNYIQKPLKENNISFQNNLFISMDKMHGDSERGKEMMGGKHFKNIETDEFKRYIEDKELNILHFSTHGLANIAEPLNSFLKFNSTKLSLLEIHGLVFNANLVNISACETYLSKLKGADEVLAFERAFLIVGAKNVISTFSTVDNMRTINFMSSFYENLKDNQYEFSKSFQKSCLKEIDSDIMEWSLFRLTGF